MPETDAHYIHMLCFNEFDWVQAPEIFYVIDLVVYPLLQIIP